MLRTLSAAAAGITSGTAYNLIYGGTWEGGVISFVVCLGVIYIWRYVRS